MTKLKNALTYIFLTVVSFLSVFPLGWMVISSTNTSNQILGGKLSFGSNLIVNYQNLLDHQPLWSAMWNSARNAIFVTLLAVLICSMAGYGFEVFHSKFKDLVFRILLLAIMVPFAALMIPLFQMFANMGLLNTMTAIVLPTISIPLLIMLFRQSARSFPQEMIDSSRIDGLSEVRIFVLMFMPTMRSTYGAAVVVTFMSAWNNYLWPKVVLLDNEAMTMPMIVANLQGGYVTDFGVVMIGILLMTLPTAILFLMLQRSFAEGITGAIK